ncbi:MAG: SurA N-terminal domain-containing protein [Candidatus Omnitrophota bacterium]
MKSAPLLLAFFLLCCVLGGCGGSSQQESQKPAEPSAAAAVPSPFFKAESTPPAKDDLLLAEWNTGKIYLSQLEKLAAPERERLQKLTQDEKLIDKALVKKRGEILVVLIDNYLLLLEAQDRKITVTEAEKEQLLRNAQSKFNTLEEYKNYLKQTGQTEEALLRILAQTILGRKCMEQKSEEIRAAMTDKELRKFYDDNIRLFTSIARSDINRVEVRWGEKRTEEEAKTLAEKIYEEVRVKLEPLSLFEEKLKVMQEYADKYSDTSEAKYNWGYIVIHHNENAPEIYSQALLDEIARTPIHEFSKLVKTNLGYAFFLVRDKFESQKHDYNHPAIQNMLPNMYMKKKMYEWQEQLMKKFDFRLIEENLRGVTPLPLRADDIFNVSMAGPAKE